VLLDLPKPEPEVDRIDRELLARLGASGDAAARRSAAERLGLRDCLAAAPALAETLRTDASQWVRAECARALGRVGEEAAEPALSAALAADASAQCRTEAARALGRVGGRSAAAGLLRALHDPSPAVAAAAARSLGESHAPEASAALAAALGSRSEAVRRAAALALRDLAGGGALAAEDLARVRALATGGEVPARAAALLALAGADPRAAAGLLGAALESRDPELLRAACEAAAELAAGREPPGAAVRERLAELCGADDPAMRLGAAGARLAGAGAERRAALAALGALLGDSRAVAWGGGEPEAVSRLAVRALRELTGREPPAEPEAWKAWLERLP
jgi:HEAT repeat protein